MNVKAERQIAVTEAIQHIKSILSKELSVASLQQAKKIMLDLASRKTLFPRSDFPIPTKQQIDRTFLIHEEDNGEYALYVNSSLPGQQSRPHDHGNSWAIVAAVEGEEVHRVYNIEINKTDVETAKIKQASEMVVKPGHAISLMPNGVHSIHAVSDNPLLHLHLYGKGFAYQNQRKEFDLDTGKVQHFVLEDIGFIEDAR